METYTEHLHKKQEEHQKRIAKITREFMCSEYLKDFYNAVLEEQDQDIFGDGIKEGGIGEGHYYPTIRKCLEDALYQFFEQDWKIIREHKKMYEYIADTVSETLQQEAEYMDDFEDYIDTRYGTRVIVSADLDNILEDLRKEMKKVTTDEMIELFVTEVKQKCQR